MRLAAKLAFQVDKRAQYQGTGIFRSRQVNVLECGPDRLIAAVHANGVNRVSLRLDHALRIWCTCRDFKYRYCGHIWAAVLEADNRGALSDAAEMDAIPLVCEDPDPLRRVQFGQKVPGASRPQVQIPPPPQIPVWKEHLNAIQRGLKQERPPAAAATDIQVAYVVEPAASRSAGAIVLKFYSQHLKKSGEWSPFKEFKIGLSEMARLSDPTDVEVVSTLLGAPDYYVVTYGYSSGTAQKTLPQHLAAKILPVLSAAGRLYIRNLDGPREFTPITWDDGEPWRLWLGVHQDDRDQWTIAGSLRRGDEHMDLKTPLILLACGFLITRDRVARFEAGGAFPWVARLRESGPIPFPDRERDAVLGELLSCTPLPPLDVDEPLQFEERRVPPCFGLRITQKRDWNGEYFDSKFLTDYGEGWIDQTQPGGRWLPEQRVYIARDLPAESAARDLLRELGLKEVSDAAGWRLNPRSMPKVVRELVHKGWHVEAEGKAFRRPGATRVDVRSRQDTGSGIDWFELHAEVDYEGATASLPQLLAAMRRGDTMVALGDGSFGLLPEEWLKRFAPLAGLGSSQEEHLRFRQNQAGLLDALLAAQPEVRVDEVFERVRGRLRDFRGVAAADQPAGFTGQLRDYQRDGLGWMNFLREFGFGGCLADDMGVGKTVQVLALLESRRAEGRGPSLVVAPKSVMFNWREEAARFTPQLRVLEHTGIAREISLIGQHDLVLTTYGTLVRDAPLLAEIQFDYVVLDEAQAIKNASTASAKAVRLLRGQNRLALSGTPIENHLGELWSLFEFLNPGMLGEAKVLKMAGGLGRNPSPEARKLLSDALRPFILRRTKRQVARELPEKTEQTIFCELEEAQRKQYDELRAHYRQALLSRVEQQGLAKSKMHVLEALLRLRQAACHPGLLDPKLADEPSAKLDVLMYQLAEVREEGHKALVFSQFTSLLALVRERLDVEHIRYEYLDGATNNRQAHVDAFQTDPDCGLFLISLKAGGLGLNLTAAEYVFLLDPWWNPAVEAQAVDRAHRIGQTRPVFAYRLIARDTVEEKVLELQKIKRELADAIIGEDHSLIRDLKREDLELLLS